MYFDSLTDALQMAGHGAFVWSAYGITLLVVVYLVWAPLVRSRSTVRRIRASTFADSNPSTLESLRGSNNAP
ncbi:heme exporter protein CcmD [Luminiphilus syltensis]|uniref:heme exporter protein CcmD n=1 Tax=Luminiphilus syltensis TaxID=1341119 RepID=UPI00058E2CD4|nr:heme exporter protein CcmD [Luminiphilus syltensis]